jgi:crossover junction endodeoxyribonuclease RuvC
MAVIGLDPGSAITGFGILEERADHSLAVIDYGVLRTGPELPQAERLQSIYEQLNQILVLHRPDSGAVENLFFQRNVRTAIAVGQARGVLLLALAQADIPVVEYNPMEIKQAVAGYGKADKQQVQQMVKMLLGLDEIPRPDDAADALAVAICHIHSRKFNQLKQV